MPTKLTEENKSLESEIEEKILQDISKPVVVEETENTDSPKEPFGENMEELYPMTDYQLEKALSELTYEYKAYYRHNYYFLRINKERPDNVKIVFNVMQTINKLRRIGYYRYDMPDGSIQYVHIQDNKISTVTQMQIRDAFETYIRQNGSCKKTATDKNGLSITKEVQSYEILDTFYSQAKTILSPENLERLRPLAEDGSIRPIKIMSDTKDSKYFFFKDCIVEVFRNQSVYLNDERIYYGNGICYITYETHTPFFIFNDKMEQLEVGATKYVQRGCIWESSIIDRCIKPSKNEIGDFGIFCQCISGTQDKTRIQSLRTILGYLMHDNYECDLRAALFTDVNQDDTAHAAGRTGKGLLAKALSQMLNRDVNQDSKMITAPGKEFTVDNGKRYGSGDMTTQLIHIEDLNRKFKLEDIYGDITDGVHIEKKYMNPVYRQAKIMLSMNQALRLKGSSDKGRVIIFELANFFSDTNRPGTFFGKIHKMKERRFFGKDWDEQEWQKFDTFMINCVLEYFKNDIIEPKDINFSQRAAREAVGDNLWYFLEDEKYFGGVVYGIRKMFDKSEMYRQYNQKYPGEFQTQRYFTQAVSNYLEAKNISSAVWRNGHDWFILYPDDNDGRKQQMQFIVKPEPINKFENNTTFTF